MPMAISLKYTLSMILFQCLHEFEFVILTNCLLKKSYTFDLCMFLGDSKHLTMTFTFFFFIFIFIFFLSRLKIDIYLIMVFFLVSFINFSKGFFSPLVRIFELLHPYPPQSQASEPHFVASSCLRLEEDMP